MAYELPLVRVYQQLEDVSPALASPDLAPCIIGRAYHVMTYADNKSEIFGIAYDPNAITEFSLPNNKPGALLESSFAKLYFDDMYIEVADGTFDAVENEASVEDTGAAFAATDVAVGDRIIITHASLSSDIDGIVLAIDGDILEVNKNFAAAMAGATYSVLKKLDDRLMADSAWSEDDGTVSVSPSLTYTYNASAYDIVEADMYFEYKALRTDLGVDMGEIGSTAEIISQVGVINKENPLALGLSLCRSNTTTLVNYYGVPSVEDDDLGWSEVKDVLENNVSVYFLALLTDKASIIGSFKAHCEGMSTAEEHGWRVCSGGIPLLLEKEIVAESSTGEIYDDGGEFKFRDNDAEFLVDAVIPSDRIEITAPAIVTGSYVVDTVVNDNVIEPFTTTPFDQAQTGVTYTIMRDLTKSQQAGEVAAGIDSYNSKRVIITWPDEIEISGESVEGYFLGCVIAGMVAGLPPHQGFTNLGIGGVEVIKHSNTYFKKEHLNTIAEAGGYIFVQDSVNALPYVRHQLTTDTQYIETRELSVVKNFDHLSYYFFEVLSPFIGPYNVTDATVKLVTSTLNRAALAKTKQVLPNIGAPLKGFTLVYSGQSEVSSDKIEAKLRLDLPKPLNGIDLFLAI